MKTLRVKQLLNVCTMKFLIPLICFGLLLSCDSRNKIEADIEAISMEVPIVRFDKEFAQTTPATLTDLKKRYPVFFPVQFHDSIWLNNMSDTIQQLLNTEVEKAFPDNDNIEDELLPLFQHIKYYFPEFEAPTTVTVTSDVDFQNKVIVADTLLVVALDTYLGAEHEFYVNIKKYIAKNLKPSQLAPDVAEAYAKQLVMSPRQRTFLDQIVYFGKILYLKELWLPETSQASIMGYTDEEMAWANDNEEEMWRYFIENELLYSTDAKLAPRFILDAPFSKFYLEIDNESPGRVGRYVGWQMVRAYMKNSTSSVKELMTKGANDLYKESKYKPNKK